jgi:hypothetical protein
VHDRTVRQPWLSVALYSLFIAGVIATGLLLALLFTLPFPLAKALADRLTLDGTLDSFTPETVSTLLTLRYVGFGLLGAAVGMLVARRRAIAGFARLLTRLTKLLQTFLIDARLFWLDLSEAFRPRLVWLSVLGLSILSAINNATLLARPMEHDEAYTYIAFASRPVIHLLRDYHLPNNHIFHSLLVYLSINLFGIEPWFVRLPAFLAGVLLVPLAFLVGRAYYTSTAGLLAAGAAALLPAIGEYASQARGYTMVAVAALALLGLSIIVKSYRNTFAWFAWIVVAALGLYTLPIMLYPLGGAVLWLLITALARDVSPAYQGRFLAHLGSAAFLTGALTGLLYLPVVLYSGVASLTANPFVRGLAWKPFTENLLTRLNSTWLEWVAGVPTWLVALLAGGFMLSWLFNRRFGKHRVYPPLAFLLWIAVLLLIQRVAPLPRIWFFALPLFLVYTAGGLAGALGWLASRTARPERVVRRVTYLALIGILLAGVYQLTLEVPRLVLAPPGPVEQAALFLKGQLSTEPAGETLVVIGSTDGPSLMYYFDRHGLSRRYLLAEMSPATRIVYVIANTGLGENPQTVLEASQRMDQLPAIQPDEPLQRFGALAVYRIAWR